MLWMTSMWYNNWNSERRDYDNRNYNGGLWLIRYYIINYLKGLSIRVHVLFSMIIICSNVQFILDFNNKEL